MDCVPVNGLVFDQQSINAIEDIKRRVDMFNTLSKVMTWGAFFNIFTGKGKGSVISTAHNIKQTDFKTLAKALDSLPSIQRKIIYDIATRQALLHASQFKEKMFWIGVAGGCNVE